LAAGAAAGGLHLDVSMPGRLRKLRKAAASIAFGLGIYGIIVTFSPAPLQSPKWETDWKTAMIVAKSAGSPAIIDFYADWCTACKELDHGTWSAPEVIAESERFTMIRVDATAAGEDIDKLEDDLDVVGLPAVLFLDADGKEIKNLRVTGFIRPARMLEKMRSVK
jgi:thiol:disulfide interchange protein